MYSYLTAFETFSKQNIRKSRSYRAVTRLVSLDCFYTAYVLKLTLHIDTEIQFVM